MTTLPNVRSPTGHTEGGVLDINPSAYHSVLAISRRCRISDPLAAPADHLRLDRDYSAVSETFVVNLSLPATLGTAKPELSSKTVHLLAPAYVMGGRDMKGKVAMSSRNQSGHASWLLPSSLATSAYRSISARRTPVYLPPVVPGDLTIHSRKVFIAVNAVLQAH